MPCTDCTARNPGPTRSRRLLGSALLAAAMAAASATAQASVQITEYMYNGNGATGEFVEFTNMGSTPVDMTGWSYDDDSRTPGVFSLTGFGVLQPGQSAVMAEASAAAFIAAWNLPASVIVLGSNTANLGRSDEINLFDAGGVLVDRLTYSDVNFPGTVRAQNFSANPLTLADLQPLAITTGWVLARVGDGFGSYASTLGDVGNPGFFALAIPEPSTWALWLAGLAGVAAIARRRG
jgi:predicted extracellular nuclease